MSKASTDRLQRQLVELLKLPGNNTCADCQSRNARWASWNLGIFLCERCAGLHRRIGSHISKVKSLTHDTWSRDQVEAMKSQGNTKSNAYFNPDSRRNPPPTTTDESDREGQLEHFIRNKYEYRAFVDAPSSQQQQQAQQSAFSTPVGRTPTPAPSYAQPAQQQPTTTTTPAPPTANAAFLAFLDALSPTPTYRPSTAPPPAHLSRQIDTSYRSTSAAPASKRVRFLPPEEIPDSDEDDEEPPPKMPSRARPKRSILAPRSSKGLVWPGEGGASYVPKPPVEWHEEDVVDNQGHLAPQPLTPQGTGWSQAPQQGWSAQGAYQPQNQHQQQQQNQQQQQALSAGGMFGGLGGGAGGSLPPLTAQGTGYPRTGSPFAPQAQQPQQTGSGFMPQTGQPSTSAGSSLMPPAPAPLTHQLTGWTPRGPSPIPPTFEPGGSLSGSSFANPTANGAAPIGAQNAPGTSNNAPQYGRGPSPGPFASLHLTPGGTPPPGQMHSYHQQQPNAFQPQPLTAQGTGYPGRSSPNPFSFAQQQQPQQTGFARNASPGPFDGPPLPNRPSPSPLAQQQTGFPRQSSPFDPNQLQNQPTGYGAGGSSIGLGHPSGAQFGGAGQGMRNVSNASTTSNASFQSTGSYNPFASAMQGNQQSQFQQQQPQQQQQNVPPPLPARPGTQPVKQSSSIWDDLSDLNTPQPAPGFQSNSSFNNQNDSPFDFGPSPSANGSQLNSSFSSQNSFNPKPNNSSNGSFLGASNTSNGSFLNSSQNSQASSSSFLSANSATGRAPGKAFVPSSAFGQELAKDLGGGGGLGSNLDQGGRFTPSPSLMTPTQSAQGGQGGSYFGGMNGSQGGAGGGGPNPFFGMGSQLGSSLPNVQQPQQTGINPFNFGQHQQPPQQQQFGGAGMGQQPNGFYGQQRAQQQQANDNPFNFF